MAGVLVSMAERDDQRPLYTLQAVIRETGIRPDTLRAWERRYGLPMPRRTSGGHRLYSQRDIEMIRWLLRRQSEGMRISQAIALWRALEAAGQDPLQVPEAVSTPTEGDLASIEALRSRWVEAVLAFREEDADRIWDEALALYPVERVCTGLAMAGMIEVGKRWFEGKATAQQEHFASVLVIRRLSAMIAAAPPPVRPERILIACPPQENHTLVHLMVGLFLRRRGWPVVDLGADVPLTQLEQTLEDLRPNLVLMTAQTLYTASTLADAAERIRCSGIPLAFGGRVFQQYPELRRYIPGHYLGDRLEEVPQRISSILRSPQHPPFPSLPAEFQEGLQRYRSHRWWIEADLPRHAGEALLLMNQLDLDVVSLGSILDAVLRLGMVDPLRGELQWLADLFQNQRLPLHTLQGVMKGYASGLRRISEPGDVLDLLAQILEEEAARLDERKPSG